MAYILLSYVGSDQAAARSLLKLLESAGHIVYSTDPDAPAFRKHASAVVVVWSNAAIASPYVYEDARIALKHNRLVQVVTDDLDTSRLPTVFRVRQLVPIADEEQILKTLSEIVRGSIGDDGIALFAFASLAEPRALCPAAQPSVSTKEGASATNAMREPTRIAAMIRKADRAAPANGKARQQPPPIPRHFSQAALMKESGQLAHKIPDVMRVGIAELVEVRLSQANRVIEVGIPGHGEVTIEDLPIVETMTVDLYGLQSAFRIVPLSRQTQLVMGSLLSDTTFGGERFGRWRWEVTPQKTGNRELLLKVSADMSDSRGVPTSEELQDRTFHIRVRVNFARASFRALKWAATGVGGMLVAGLVGAYTQEWWPRL